MAFSPPEPKTKIYPNGIILGELIALIFNSHFHYSEYAAFLAKRIITNLEICQKDRIIGQEEFQELGKIEKEVMETKKYYKNEKETLETRIFAAKILFLFNGIIFFIGLLAYAIYRYQNEDPTISSGFLLKMMVVTITTYYTVFFAIRGLKKLQCKPAPTPESIAQPETMKKSEHEGIPSSRKVYFAPAMKTEQLRLIELFMDEAYAAKVEAEDTEWYRDAWMSFAVSPYFIFVAYCFFCFLYRGYTTEITSELPGILVSIVFTRFYSPFKTWPF